MDEPRTSFLSRRHVLTGAAAIAAGVGTGALSSAGNTAWAGAEMSAARSSATRFTSNSFAKPPAADATWVRWVLGPQLTDDELRKELTSMRDAGISGAELGQGNYPSTAQLKVILQRANEVGVTISLSHGPVSAPDGFSIDDDDARKNLAYGSALVPGGSTFDAAIPAQTSVNSARSTLVGVLAYRVTGTWTAGVTNTLDADSVLDLTARVTGTDTAGIHGGTTTGKLTWAAPTGSTWVLIALYAVGSLAQPDLLTEAGRLILTRNLDKELAPVARLLRTNQSELFYDSHTGDRGSPADTWSNTITQEFQSRVGYPLLPWAPLLLNLPSTGFGSPPKPVFTFDTARTAKFLNDFAQVRTDVWLATQVLPLQKWAHTYGLKVRLQPYGEAGLAVDSIQAAAALDKVETETLWFGDVVDNYLPEASAVHMTGRTWYSIEGSAAVGQAYAQTWQDQVIRMNKAFAGGVTKLVYHLFPYASGPDSVWPGYSLFPDSFSNSWGPRSPHWKDARGVNDYFARTQQILTQGQAKRDVAVYMQNYLYPQPYTRGNLQYWSDPSLERAGYTRDYLNPTLLNLPNAVVRKGVLAADGPAYKALVIDGKQQPAAAASNTGIPLTTARKILALGRAGLPVIIVEPVPTATPGNDDDDAQVKAVVAQLLALPTTYRVADEAAVPALLARLGIQPAAKPATPGPVLTAHRRDAATDFYWFYNQTSAITPKEPANLFEPLTGTPVTVDFTLAGSGTPFQLDPWSGTITPIARYQVGKGTVTVQVSLGPEASTIVALTSDPRRFGCDGLDVHVESTTAQRVRSKGRALFIESQYPGTFNSTLSNGRRITSRIDEVPPVLDLTTSRWTLQAEDWRPSKPYGTTGNDATLTDKKSVTLTLNGLVAWPNIPALTDASGTGVYTIDFTLPRTWRAGTPATLNLGQVTDSFTVSVNGHDLAFPDQLSALVEVGENLRAGSNRLTVRVSTTLINRLRTLNTTQSAWAQQANGLVGPVTITPYGRTEVTDGKH